MSEVNEGDQTNMWLPPRSGSGGPKPPGPRDPSEPKADETSASARALAEGWPAHPGWVPDGAHAWSAGEQYATPDQYAAPDNYAVPTQPPGNQYQDSQYPGTQQYGAQPGWIPTQSPYPTTPDASGAGYGHGPATPYPGPPPPLPGSNTGKIVGIVVAVVALIAAGVTAGVVLSGRGSDSPDSVATAPASSTGGTGSGGTDAGRRQDSSGSTGSSNNSGGTRSNGASSTPQTGTSGGTDQPPGTGPLNLRTVTLGGAVTGADAADMALTLDAYFTGINSGDYASAWSQLSPNQQAKNPFGQFTEATSGTIDHDVRLASATPNSDGTARASVTFTSTQPGSKGVNAGETCTDWSITYSLVRGSGAGGWVISDTPSAQHSAC